MLSWDSPTFIILRGSKVERRKWKIERGRKDVEGER